MTDGFEDVEWREEATLDSEMRRCQAAQRDDLAVVARADPNDSPARATHVYEIAGSNAGLAVAFCT